MSGSSSKRTATQNHIAGSLTCEGLLGIFCDFSSKDVALACRGDSLRTLRYGDWAVRNRLSDAGIVHSQLLTWTMTQRALAS